MHNIIKTGNPNQGLFQMHKQISTILMFCLHFKNEFLCMALFYTATQIGPKFDKVNFFH